MVAGIADAETGQPLEGAEVLLVELHRLARANQMGEARLDGVPRGSQLVRVRMLGYAPSEIRLAFAGDTTGAVFRLTRSAIQLGAVNVEASWTPVKMKDVQGRYRQGIGRFLTAEDLDKERDRDFAYLVTARFPGIRVVTNQNGQQSFVSTRGGCAVDVYLDDIPFSATEDIWMIKTWDLAMVEYYTGSQVPAMYRSRTRASPCGLLLAWSKWY